MIESLVSVGKVVKDGGIYRTIYNDDSSFFESLENITGAQKDSIKMIYGYSNMYVTANTYELICKFVKSAYMFWNVLIHLTSIMKIDDEYVRDNFKGSYDFITGSRLPKSKEDMCCQNTIDDLVNVYNLRNMYEHNYLSIEQRFSRYIKNMSDLINYFCENYIVTNEDNERIVTFCDDELMKAKLFSKQCGFMS